MKTTEPNNYIVRPNQGIVPPDTISSIKIMCNVPVVVRIFIKDKLILE